MEKNKNSHIKSAVPLAVVVVIALAFGAALGVGSYGTDANDAMRFKNLVSVEVKHPSCADFPDNPECGMPGKTEYAWNTVTTELKNWTRNALSNLADLDNTANNITVIELSTDSGAPSADDTACPATLVTGNGLGIARGSVTAVAGTGNYTVSKTFSVTGTQAGIVKVCLSNNTATGSTDLMASALISSTNVANGDTLQVNYSIAVV